MDISLNIHPTALEFCIDNDRGKRVSDFNVRTKFSFYVKKRVTFGHFLKLFFSRLHKIKTRTKIKNLRHASI